jgi:hypothetical protein
MITDSHALSISYSCIMININAPTWHDCIFLSCDFQNSIKPCLCCFEIPEVVYIDKILIEQYVHVYNLAISLLFFVYFINIYIYIYIYLTAYVKLFFFFVN